MYIVFVLTVLLPKSEPPDVLLKADEAPKVDVEFPNKLAVVLAPKMLLVCCVWPNRPVPVLDPNPPTYIKSK